MIGSDVRSILFYGTTLTKSDLERLAVYKNAQQGRSKNRTIRNVDVYSKINSEYRKRCLFKGEVRS